MENRSNLDNLDLALCHGFRKLETQNRRVTVWSEPLHKLGGFDGMALEFHGAEYMASAGHHRPSAGSALCGTLFALRDVRVCLE